jgi:hypothetical protein
VSYKIFNEDTDIINFDGLSIEEIDYYLHSRVDRRNAIREWKSSYLRMIPLLWGLRNRLVEERKWEANFIRMLIDEMKRKNIKIPNAKGSILKAVDWWKTKNKWKRPLNKDDTKAFRMIKERLGIHVI